LGNDLGNQEHFVTSAPNRFGDQRLDGARSVHLGRIDMRHPEVEATAEGRDRGCAVGRLEMPRPLADYCDFRLCGTEPATLHRHSPLPR